MSIEKRIIWCWFGKGKLSELEKACSATLYCTHQPCTICCRMIINSGIKKVVYVEGYPDEFSLELFKEAGIEVVKYVD